MNNTYLIKFYNLLIEKNLIKHSKLKSLSLLQNVALEQVRFKKSDEYKQNETILWERTCLELRQ